jgi:membrane-bound inhibitor of C-type lysozyme
MRSIRPRDDSMSMYYDIVFYDGVAEQQVLMSPFDDVVQSRKCDYACQDDYCPIHVRNVTDDGDVLRAVETSQLEQSAKDSW